MCAFTGDIRKTTKPVGDEHYRPYLELDCRLCQHFSAGTLTTPLVVVDVGCRGGFDPRWGVFGKHIFEVGFEADAQEKDRISSEIVANGETANKEVRSSVLWSEAGKMQFNIPQGKEAASILEPNMKFYSRLPEPTYNAVKERIEVTTTTLDACSWPNNTVDFLKIDVEGADIFVLQGGKRLLETQVLGVAIEATFVGQYLEQGFFADIDIMLRKMGFAFFDLKPRRWRRKKLGPEFDNLRVGQLVVGDALYLKDPVVAWDQFCSKGVEGDKLLKLAAIAEYFSLPDYAMEIVELAKEGGYCSPEVNCELISLLQSNRIVAFNDFTRHGVKARIEL